MSPPRENAGLRVLAGVLNYRRADLTDQVVRQLAGQFDDPALTVVVVDDGSPRDEFDDLTRRVDGRAEIIRLPSNLGFGGACNALASRAVRDGYQAVWFLNNDLVFDNNVLGALRDELERQPGVAAVAPVTIDGAGSRVLGAGVDYGRWLVRVTHRLYGRPLVAIPIEPVDVPVLEGACLLVSTEALAVIGGFDEGFGMYWEDTEWSLRAAAVGYRLRIVPSARVRHLSGQSSSSSDRVTRLISNRIRLSRRHGTPLEQAVFLLYFVVGWLPAYFAFRLIPHFGPRQALRIARRAVGLQLRDAIARKRWRLRAEDQAIPYFT